jgi:hypothetical protein
VAPPATTVVATDSASVDADHDNGAVLHGTARFRGCDGGKGSSRRRREPREEARFASPAFRWPHASWDNGLRGVPRGARGGWRMDLGVALWPRRREWCTQMREISCEARLCCSSYPGACSEYRGSSRRPPLWPCCVVALLSVDSRERTFCALRPTSRYSAASIAHGGRGETRGIVSSRRRPARTLAPRGRRELSGRARIPPRG